MSPIVVALTVLLVIVLIAYLLRVLGLAGALRERFASPKAHDLHRRTVDVFAQNGRATYSEYKAAIPEADPVLYSDLRQKVRRGRLTPEDVEHAM